MITLHFTILHYPTIFAEYIRRHYLRQQGSTSATISLNTTTKSVSTIITIPSNLITEHLRRHYLRQQGSTSATISLNTTTKSVSTTSTRGSTRGYAPRRTFPSWTSGELHVYCHVHCHVHCPVLSERLLLLTYTRTLVHSYIPHFY